MAAKALPSPEVLRQLLRYEPDTGKLFWLPRGNVQWDAQFSGREAFTADSGKGYRTGKVLDVACRAHRLIWAIHYGVWPEKDIDHINGVRSDNRIVNLRIVSRGDNNRNARRPKDNSSGMVGIYRTKFGWAAGISGRHIKRTKCLGVAIKLRKAAERDLGFHPNHGRVV